MCSAHKQMQDAIRYTWNLTTRDLQISSLKKKKKSRFHNNTITITALEKLNVLENYKGCTLLTKGIADNQ